MKPWELLGRTRTPDGAEMALTRRDGEYVILANGKSLMSSRMHGSEEALATFACRGRARWSSRACSSAASAWASRCAPRSICCRRTRPVVVAELVPAVVEWNRGPLGPLAGHPLKDRACRVEVGDVAATLRASPDRFDAVLLDVDNGPAAFTASGNAGLYDDRGLAAARAALKPGGVLAVWSAWEDRKFEQRLRYGRVRSRGRARARAPEEGRPAPHDLPRERLDVRHRPACRAPRPSAFHFAFDRLIRFASS